jgi:hypothetical protein
MKVLPFVTIDSSKTGRCIFDGKRQARSGKRLCYAWNGLSGYDLGSDAPVATTSALSAAGPPTTLSHATSLHDWLPVRTPFIPDVWERMLNDISPFNPFPDVPIGLRFGFDMGVHTPPSYTFTPPNHSSALSFPDHVISHIRNELSLGRYSGPFSRSRLEF